MCHGVRVGRKVSGKVRVGDEMDSSMSFMLHKVGTNSSVLQVQ